MHLTKADIVIIGAGPAGIFTALELKRLCPKRSVLMVELGAAIDKRSCPARKTGHCVHCTPCNIMSGWAGAGAFSDGKLSLSEEVGGNIVDYMPLEQARELIRCADGIYTRFGAPETVHGLGGKEVDQIDYECRRHNIKLIRCPVRHMGTEYSFETLRAMYVHLSSLDGFTFLSHTKACSVLTENGRVSGVTLESGGDRWTVETGTVVAAPGRGGAAWLAHLAQEHGIPIRSNEVDIGVRVETPNAVMDHITAHLYEAKMVYYSDTFENRVRTFCMNPGGIVSEEHYASEDSHKSIAVVNGHSYAEKERRTGNTNFAMLVSSRFTEPFDRPIAYGKYIAQLGNMLTGGGIMVQRLGDLLQGRRTDTARLARSTTVPTLPTAVPGDLSFVLPHRHLTSIIEALRAFDKVMPGLYSKNTLLYGVEVKFYSSKIEVGADFSTAVGGLYAIGDGAGITRGLMQASATGIAVARHIAGS